MARQSVKSTDPRKPAIVAALKAASGGDRITNVYESGPNCFHGDALKWVHRGRRGDYDRLGHFTTVLEPEGWTPAVPSEWSFEVNYEQGKGWEPTETKRALSILGDAYKPLAPILDLMVKGQEIRTPFAFYRLNVAGA